jgi:hypothetical protein
MHVPSVWAIVDGLMDQIVAIIVCRIIKYQMILPTIITDIAIVYPLPVGIVVNTVTILHRLVVAIDDLATIGVPKEISFGIRNS